MESCTCSDYISPELKTPSHYFGGDGTSEEIGLRLMKDLNIADGRGEGGREDAVSHGPAKRATEGRSVGVEDGAGDAA